MEHLDSVMLSVLDICALVWYARQRARRWLLRLVWMAGAMLGFVLVGPLALVVWVAVPLVIKLDRARAGGDDSYYKIIDAHEDLKIAKKWQKISGANAKF
ncbi:MAG: hypothetical protein ACREYE_25365 [Gammaproteobacteria bacterium]